MDHQWEEFGDEHECSYVDCYCDHPTCLKCGVEQDSEEANFPCVGWKRCERTKALILECWEHAQTLEGPEKGDFFFLLSKLGSGAPCFENRGCEPILNRYRDPHKRCFLPGKCRCRCITCTQGELV